MRRVETSVWIDLKKNRAIWEDFRDVLVSESRREEKGLLMSNTARLA